MRKRNRTERRQTSRIMNNITQEEPKRIFSDEDIDNIFNSKQTIKHMHGEVGLKEVATLSIGRPRKRGVGANLYITSVNRDIFATLSGCKKYDVRFEKRGGWYAAYIQADTPQSTIKNTEKSYPKDRIALNVVREMLAGIFEGDYEKQFTADAKESYVAKNGTVILAFRRN